MNQHIKVREIEEMQLIAISVTGFDKVADGYEKLVNWSASKGLLKLTETKMVTIYHDSARDTPHNKVRISACITAGKEVAVTGDFKSINFKPIRCIVASMEIGMSEFEKAWKSLFTWMQEHGHQKAAEDPFEIYHNNYQEHPQKKCIVDLCIPIE